MSEGYAVSGGARRGSAQAAEEPGLVEGEADDRDDREDQREVHGLLRASECRTAMQAAGLIGQGAERAVDGVEAAAKHGRRHAESYAQMPLRAEVRAGHDHRAPVRDEPVHEL